MKYKNTILETHLLVLMGHAIQLAAQLLSCGLTLQCFLFSGCELALQGGAFCSLLPQL